MPLIAVNDALYHHPEQRELQDIVTCIREHVTLDEAGKRLEANAERHLKAAGGNGAAVPRLSRSDGRDAALRRAASASPWLNWDRVIRASRCRRARPPTAICATDRSGLDAALSARRSAQGRASWRKRNCASSPSGRSRIISSPCMTSWSSPAARTFSARGAARPPIPWSVMPWASPPSIPRSRCAVRALPQHRAPRAARHRRGFRA